jgi:hypothetical protein
LKFNDYLDHIPTAICILNETADVVLYHNKQIEEQAFQKYSDVDLIDYFKSLCIPIEELRKKFPNVNFEDQYQEEDEMSEQAK